MRKLLMILAISVIASVMMIGSIIASPDAYSDKNHDDVLDECKCEKPHTLKVQFNAPVDGPFKIEIYKKLDDRNDPEKLPLQTFNDVPKDHIEGDPLVISSIIFGKDKLESNTAFVVYKVVENQPDVEVALLEIHTSCSKPLYQDLVVSNNGYSLKVEDGLSGTNPSMSSIPIGNPEICEDKKSKSTGSITVKKAITNDNGGTAEAVNFEITITNVETTEKITLVHDIVDPDNPLINVNNVPVGTYTISETPPTNKGTYTTVLIAGDTGCPSMLEEVFSIKKNKNLSCTIYNDDNDDGSTGGPGGIVFTNESLQIVSADPTTHDSCDNPSIEFFNEDGIQILPCIQIIDEQAVIAIVDPELKDNLRTIVLFSVFESALDANGAAKDPQCVLESILPHNDLSNDLPIESKATSNLVVKLACSDINSNTLINVNYVMIDPLSQ
jgi:hypothetical protein